MKVQQLREMVEEAVSAFLDEINYNDRMAALQTQRAATGGGGQDQMQIGQLIGALDTMRKSGKATVSMPELQGAMKKATAVATPLGKGAVSDPSMAAAAKAVSGPTGGAPVVRPPDFPSYDFARREGPDYARRSLAMAQQREGKVRMSETQLKEMVSYVVAKKLHESFGMSNPIMAKREIIALMDQTSRSFEQEIIKTFKLQNPDDLSPELQRRYLEIVENMKAKLVQASMEAVQELIKFPKLDQGNGGMK